MSGLGRGLPLLALLALAACGGEHRDAGEQHEDPPLRAEDATAAEDDEYAVLRVHSEMLRDLRLTTAPVEVRGAVEGMSVLGELGPNESTYAVLSAPVPARIVRMIAGAGEPVAAGEPLAELQSGELGRARSDLLAARARLELARRARARRAALVGERIVPRRELEEAEAGERAAAAELAAAEARLSAVGVPEDDLAPDGRDASRFILRSPIAGTVLERSGVQGEQVTPERPLYRVADISVLWLVVHAFERDAVRLRPGVTAEVTFAALPGQVFTGPVTNVARQVDPVSRTVRVRIDVDNASGVLRPGMSATAVLPAGDPAARVLAVPGAALQRLERGWAVFVPRGEGVFAVRSVGRGRDLGGEVEILSGLEAGEQVVVDGAFLLKAEVEKSRGEGEHHDH